MKYVRLGRSGLHVSQLCLGTMNMGTPDWKPWIFDEAQSELIVKYALDKGVNFIDLADFITVSATVFDLSAISFALSALISSL